MSANDKADAAWDDYVSQQQEEKIEELERELNAANDRIKRLQNAGDGLSMWVCPEYKSDPANIALIEWRKAKEAKP